MLVLTGILLLSQAEVIPSGTMIIEVVGFECDEGQAVAVIWKSDDWSFPPDPERAFQRAEEPIVSLASTIQFDDIPLGDYVVTVFHDIDSNGEFNRGNELTGVSGTPQEMSPGSGPPSAGDMIFSHDSTVSVIHIVVREMPERPGRGRR